MKFAPVDPRLFYSRNDPLDPRLGELVRDNTLPSTGKLRADRGSDRHESPTEKSDKVIVIGGYPDDDGIALNGGRVGAKLAPDTVRKYLYKMTPSVFGESRLTIFDRGNLEISAPEINAPKTGASVSTSTLAERHALAQLNARDALATDALSVTIGGGHDYGFPDAAAYIEWARARGERPLVLNFDAHLDVRPVIEGRLSSGTPFFRMLEAYPEVDFAEIGIQAHCNSKTHLAWAVARGVRILSQEERVGSGESFVSHLTRLLNDWVLKPRSVFLSVDIDGFSSMAAPGCSQSWTTGFMPDEFFAGLEFLKGRLDIRALGIYEISPPLDADDRTSKLAAQIIHRVIS